MLRRDAVGVGGIEAVAREESVGFALRQQQAIKHQGAARGIAGGKLHIVGHDQDRRAIPAQRPQQLCQLRLGVGVQSLGAPVL